MVTDYWAKPPMEREQIVLFAPTLEAMIAPDHPVRLFDEILGGLDWSNWEAHYHRVLGQPPIHPRVLAGVILYGLSRGVRSTRHLEYLVSHNLDFLWLVSGHTLDHSTICNFRKQFATELKQLFRQIGRIAMTMGLVRLGEIGFDGTRVKANNSRYETLTASTIEERLAALDEQVAAMLTEADAADKAEQQLFDTTESSRKLPQELGDLQKRQQQLKTALEKVRLADAARRRDGIDPAKNPAQIPTTDPDSKVLPNKEGGYAPNYTPMAATDGHRGFIVDADVIPDTHEASVTLATVDRIAETFGHHPEKLLADGAFATGCNIQGLEERKVEFFTNLTSSVPEPGNPAWRDDPTQPVPQADWDKLPRNPQTKKLDKSVFIYQEQTDTYYCPMGKPLEYEQTKSKPQAAGDAVKFRVYRSHHCVGCPLASSCRLDQSKKGRSVSRDIHEARRERLAAKMALEESKAIYRRRLHTAETPFAIIKHVMRLRQFLLRGLENVKTEWLWICTAFNLAKLVREVARLRAVFMRSATMEAV